MGNQITKLFDKFFSKKQAQILMFGLDAAGKTTILYQLKLGKIVHSAPTFGLNIETLECKSIKLTAFDVGYAICIQLLHRKYYKGTQGIIFVVDSSDNERVELAKEELQKLLREEELKHSPVLVFANKQDLGVMNVSDVTEKLELHKIEGREWFIQGTCALSGDGLIKGLEWLSKIIEKNN